MNRFVSVALAGSVALTAVGMSATGASAERWHQYDRPHFRNDRPHYQAAPRSDAGPALVAGAILGLAVGAMMQPQPAYPAYRTYPVYPAYPAYRTYPAHRPYAAYPAYVPPPASYAAYAANRHFQWCTATYETYNGETDTWIDYRGVPHRCISP